MMVSPIPPLSHLQAYTAQQAHHSLIRLKSIDPSTPAIANCPRQDHRAPTITTDRHQPPPTKTIIMYSPATTASHRAQSRVPTTYFPPMTNPSVTQTKPPTSALGPNSIITGCLKQNAHAEPRRASFSVAVRPSAIPIAPRTRASDGDVGARRRPSFMIDLPASSLLTSQPRVQTPFAPREPVPAFRDPFAGGEKPAVPTSSGFSEALPSPTGSGAGMVGLGYSLNKRAPTPWIRKAGADAEWLAADDLEDVSDIEGRMKGLTVG